MNERARNVAMAGWRGDGFYNEPALPWDALASLGRAVVAFLIHSWYVVDAEVFCFGFKLLLTLEISGSDRSKEEGIDR